MLFVLGIHRQIQLQRYSRGGAQHRLASVKFENLGPGIRFLSEVVAPTSNLRPRAFY
jgi:hypothetical protein